MKDLIQKILREDSLAKFSGWVNVKIDSEVNKRIERLMTGLGFRSGDLKLKIKFLSNPVQGRVKPTETIGQALNRKITAMILLEYLREMKELFNSSSGGFLFESFIAGLLGGKQVLGKGAVDVTSGSEKYQIKFYGTGSKVIKRPTEIGDQPTKIILGFKTSDGVEIYQLDYDVFLKKTKKNKYIDINEFKILADNLGTLNLSNISAMSDELNADLSTSVSSLWNTISELQFNIESMLTGISKEGSKTTTLIAANAAQNNARELDQKIGEVRGFFNPEV